MSDSSSLPPVDVIQANFDSYLGALIVQAFVSGIYTLLLFRTIRSAAPGLRKGSNVFLILLLVILYCLTMVNFSTTWVVARSFLITHNETREAMADQLFNNTLTLSQAGNGCGVVAILIADSLLVWRCYMLWNRNKILLGFFSLLLLGELAVIPILLTLNSVLGPAQVPIISLFLFISMGITMLATGSIAYRILTVSRGGPSEYSYVVEILIESGILYSTFLFITGVIQVVPNAGLSVFEAATYFTAILIPVTGIAPTLISARILTHTEQDDQRWSQPASFLVFNTIQRHNAGSATLNNTNNFSLTTKSTTMGSTDIEKRSLGNDSPELEFAPTVPAGSQPRTGNEQLMNHAAFV